MNDAQDKLVEEWIFPFSIDCKAFDIAFLSFLYWLPHELSERSS